MTIIVAAQNREGKIIIVADAAEYHGFPNWYRAVRKVKPIANRHVFMCLAGYFLGSSDGFFDYFDTDRELRQSNGDIEAIVG
ncbi:MAG: hypothetical protein HY513_05885 [Candidatus Aenigmarchaeota archaeon]|nr:hypothetical protein [Candidatus Aenigmarchaeota archaeon]